MRHPRSVAVTVLVLVGGAFAATSAQAATICVNRVSNACSQNQPAAGTLGDQLQAAIDAAEAAVGTDTLLLGDGTYERPGFVYGNSGNGSLLIQGQSVAGTRIVYPPAGAENLRTLVGQPTSGALLVRDLTVVTPSGGAFGTGIDLGTANSTVTNVRVFAPEGAAANGVKTFPVASLEDVVFDGPGMRNAIEAQGTSVDVLRVTVRANGTPLTSSANTTTVRRLDAVSPGGNSAIVRVTKGEALIENSVLDANGPADANNQAVGLSCIDATSVLRLRSVTLRSASGFGAFASCSEPGRTAQLLIERSIVAPGTGVRTVGANATVNLSNSRWDGSGVGAVSTGAGMSGENPLFEAPDNLRLRADSPFLDVLPLADSPLGEPNLGDVTGAPRVSDGTGDGAARADLGAYERQAPAVPLPAGNLLVNGGAETGSAAVSQAIAPLPEGFTRTSGSFTQVIYGGAFAALRNVGAAFGAGISYFAGGPDASSSTAEQTTSLAGAAAEIDAGRVTASLSALLGAYANEDDRASVTATFLDAAAQPVGTALALAAPPVAARGGAVILLPRSASATIPAGARSVRTVLRADRDPMGDTYLDASFDQVALTTTTAPVVAPPGGGVVPPGGGVVPPGAGVLPPVAYRGLTITKGRLRLDSKGRIAVKVACPSVSVTRCVGTLQLTRTTGTGGRKRTVRLARRSVTVLRGKSATVRLTVTRSGRRLVRSKGLAVVARAVTKDARAGAKSRGTTAKLTLLPRRR